jgi:hypothetical protein
MSPFVILVLFLGGLVALNLLARAWRKRRRERRLDANMLYEASRVVECGYRDATNNLRCIKLKGHVDSGDRQHMFYGDREDPFE